MSSHDHRSLLLSSSVLVAILLAAPAPARAHCDGLDGPVVKAAQAALKTENVRLVLVWVQKKDEPEITSAFQHTLAVRKLGPEPQKLADRFFFETLVRVHRAGEGAPYTGLQPAGRDLGPAIPAADRALETADAKPLVKLLEDAVHAGLHERFTRTLAAKRYDKEDVEAGRKFVEDYVVFVHYVERLYEDAVRSPQGHVAVAEPAAAPHAH
jgi:hypothetical protein